jgi:peroxiredoxin
VRSRSFLVAVALLALTACVRSVATEASGTRARAVTEPLPLLKGEDLHGDAISSQDFPGKVLVVNAWASWCIPYCAQEQPDLVTAAKRYRDRGVQFLGVNHMDQQATAQEWVRHYGVPYPSLYDPSGRVAGQLGYFGLPDTYVVDPSGTIRYVIGPGPATLEQLSTAIDGVLAQTSASSATATNSPAK